MLPYIYFAISTSIKLNWIPSFAVKSGLSKRHAERAGGWGVGGHGNVRSIFASEGAQYETCRESRQGGYGNVRSIFVSEGVQYESCRENGGGHGNVRSIFASEKEKCAAV